MKKVTTQGSYTLRGRKIAISDRQWLKKLKMSSILRQKNRSTEMIMISDFYDVYTVYTVTLTLKMEDY